MSPAESYSNGEAYGEDELRVSTLELFFDLVFVFTLTQLTSLVAHDPTIASMARVTLIFVVLFWMYGGYAWLTNQVPPEGVMRRLLIMCGMAAFLVCALAIPEAFDGTGVAFGVGYLLVVVVHAGLYAQSYGSVVLLFGLPNLAAALTITVAGLLDGAASYGLWAVAIATLFVTPRLTARAATTINPRVGHFVERHGLLLIVALGESVVAVGIGIGDLELDAEVFGAAVLGLVLSMTLWWIYFEGDDDRAERILSEATVDDRFRRALGAYFYAFIPMLLGVLTTAAGVEEAIGHMSEELEVGPALVLGGGVAMYLAGAVGFRLVLGIRPIAFRAAAAAIALGTVVLGTTVSGGAQLISVIVGLLVCLAVEARWSARAHV